MGIFKKAATLGIVKKVYDESRKPQNQQRIKSAVDRVQSEVRSRRGGGGRPPQGR